MINYFHFEKENLLKMKPVILTIFLLLSVTALYSQSQKELLEEAYDDNSVQLLEKFFENWRKEKLPINDSEYNKLNDVQKDVYDLFYEFYNPLDMKHMRLEEWEYTMYENIKYVIISNKIEYEFTKTLNEDEIFENYVKKVWKDDSAKITEYLNDTAYKRFCFDNLIVWGSIETYGLDSIKNFRPRVKFTDAKPLYIRKYYKNLLSEFLGSEFVPLGQYNIMQPAFSQGESEKRERFLGNFIFVMISHWGDHWEILTSPRVSYILFDAARENAKISYSFPYHSGYSVFKKIEGKWVFVKDKFAMMW
jgi:hypothetical protein